MKGIVLGGGHGTRLHPVTRAINKSLLPIYDKPLIYYPITLLMLAGIRDILLITTPHDQPNYQRLLGDGRQWGISLTYAAQTSPDGLAQAFLIGEEFIGSDRCALALGDNILHGSGLVSLLKSAARREVGGTVFCSYVENPEKYGIVEFDASGLPVAIEEKPASPRSNWALIGLYFFDNRVIEFAHSVESSDRGELEITDVARQFLACGQLQVQPLGRGYMWIDAGTHDSMLDASNFVRTVDKRQNQKISIPEEIALINGWIDKEQVSKQAFRHQNTDYGDYLLKLVHDETLAKPDVVI